MVHHEHWERSGTDDALDGRSDKDIAQELLAVRTHDDEIRLDGVRRPQDAVKRVALNRYWTALNATELGYRRYLLGEDSLCFALLDCDELLRLIVVDYVNDTKLGISRLRQQSRLPQCPI
jgi:hypothetical protein